MTDFRALCIELTDCLEKADWPLRYRYVFRQWVDIARAALADEPAAPQPQPPAEGEVAEFITQLKSYAEYGTPIRLIPFVVKRAADLMERLSPPQPVPVSERPWEREGWCDTGGLCWLGSDALDGCTPTWLYGSPAWAERFPNVHRVLLPAHALPLRNGQPSIAAALRAAADQLPLQPLTRDPADPFEQGLRQGQELSRAELLGIAAELEAT